VKYHFKEVA